MSFIFQRLLLIWLILISLVAFYWTAWFPQLPDLFGKSWSDQYLAPLIALTMFAVGVMLPRDEVQQVFRRWPSVLAGTAVQYTTMPLLAYGVAKIGGFEQEHLIGIVMVGCVPGAMASNVLTLNAGGNTSYSVSLTTMATLLSPLVVPLVLGLALAAETRVSVQFLLNASLFLLITVVVPVIVGHLTSRWGYRLADWEKNARCVGSIVANLAILLIIAAVVGRTRNLLADYRFDVLIALLAINIGGYCAGYFSGYAFRFPEPMRRALTLEVGMQNAGLGATLAIQLFSDLPAIAIAPAIYTFGCMFTGTVLATVWGMFSTPPQAETHVQQP